jgi:pimeloyl-ACP methyl ester carboxylesterase
MTYMHDEALQVLPLVLDAAGITRAILIGHSDGGSIAAIYAGAMPDQRIAGIVLIAAHFYVEDLNVESIARIRTEYDTGDLRPRLARYHVNVDVAFRGWNDAWLDPRFRAFDITEYLPGIGVPVLALQGEEDPYGTKAQLEILERQVRSPLETRLIPGARHAPHLEAKDATLAAIAAFVRTTLTEHRT